MTKSGTFEQPDDAYEAIINLYNTLHPRVVPETFEEFCGILLSIGATKFVKLMRNEIKETA